MEISLAPELLFDIFGFPVTNSFFTTVLVVFCIIIASFVLSRKISQKPKGFQNLVEFVLESILNLADNVTGSRKKSKKFFPLVATIFILVIISNWAGLIPALIPGGTLGINEIHHGEKVLIPFIRSGSADLNMTLSIALISVIAAQIMGVAMIGGKHYAGKFFVSPLKKPYFIGTFVGILEIISEFAKIISFSFRLFGNVFAGEVLLTVMLMLVPYFAPLPFLFLEIFVGFVQALVFSMLTLVFLKMATETAH
ncbi:MAG: ATP synthase subunit a [Candidatus Moranbacteria bacterium GW2011_GWE2_35_2-]|nr:MAG: ATP synthase subunit a [Candidatus Moranbacteria bacterium GW2011_GWE2_35_2-]KKQ22250.1 MAG: ATP synthase subunit a [Candidatus Moranbacteria bacterium GW2011_GWF2_37_11]KKQ28592.1 MAG: ATP synthase subunit a [Candidatus Moranbacteria bacterium GW2011_GWD1_37_17]KKQ30258.1 MAG: ATP synthase subunit a [Candidatus Moranbacteria bacterium GW2011_GWE1_37_24]KKQ47489.1 MAG: ATP synthase subunit a [Candidatus Moranbacteria bacterium GW2011_GWD2_37_9]HBO16713.1 ATP synthase F0 subunit A [Cand